MGYFDNIKEQLDKQFISVKDSITFIFHQDNCTYQDAFNLVVKTLIFDQTHLLVMDGLKLKTIFICREKDPNSHNAYITIEALITQLEKPPSDSTAKDVSNVGFGKKRFYEQLLNMGFVFDNRLLFEAQSPDIDYSDCETEADGFAYYNGLPKEYEALKRSHDKLEQQLADEKAKDRFGMGTPKIEQGEPKDSEQIISELKDQITQLTNDNASLKNQLAQANAALADKPADDKELAPNSQVKVTHMLYAILKEHGYDLSPPKGKGVANDQIVAASQTYKSPVTRNFVANWLERAHQLDIDLNK